MLFVTIYTVYEICQSMADNMCSVSTLILLFVAIYTGHEICLIMADNTRTNSLLAIRCNVASIPF